MKIKRKNIKGYYGMNEYAGKALGIKCPKGIIYVEKGLKGRMLKRTIAHEKIESYMMKKKHLKYPKAHKVAMKFEHNLK